MNFTCKPYQAETVSDYSTVTCDVFVVGVAAVVDCRNTDGAAGVGKNKTKKK